MPAHHHATLLFRHPAFSGHDTTPHPEHPDRIRAIDTELTRRNLLVDRRRPAWLPASDEHILAVHSAPLLKKLQTLTAHGGGDIDPDTVVLPDSLPAARLAAGAGIAAVDAIQKGDVTRAFVLGRPPGHHATHDRAMGFCLLNTIAITARYARRAEFQRIAIIDWDVHHGNGTQGIFYDRSDVLFSSVHRYDRSFFPGTGSAGETGVGDGLGYSVNIPLRSGSGNAAFLTALTGQIIPAVERFEPDLILLSAGYDAHVEDPLGGCVITDDGFRELTRQTRALADRLTEGRLIAVLEGGYDPTALARCTADSIEILDAPSL